MPPPSPPLIFLNEITPKRRQNIAGIFAVLCISFLTKAGGDAIGIISFFNEGESLIFRDFVGGGGGGGGTVLAFLLIGGGERAHPAGGPALAVAAPRAGAPPVTGLFRN